MIQDSEHMTSIPKVHFMYAYPLDIQRRKLFKLKDLGYYPSIEEVKATLERWKDIWSNINTDDVLIKILKDLTKRNPTRSLECFVFGGGLNPMSKPLLMPVLNNYREPYSDDEFVEIMIHELLHIFVSTDTQTYWNMIRKAYLDEDVITQNHIIVYAMLQEVCSIIFKKAPIDFSREDLPDGYIRAIKIVREKGYTHLIKEYHELIKL